MEKVAETGGLRWFQLYLYTDRQVNERLIQRAEAAGYRALVITLDAALPGKRIYQSRTSFRPPGELKFDNFEDEVLKEYQHGNITVAAYVNKHFLKDFSPDVFHWIRSLTRLPIVVKGVLSAADALAAVRVGASGILVSNHGARQLDTTPASIDVLEDIVAAVGNKAEVYIDSGFRTGTDVLKALSLGARFVFVGRATLWGLVLNGTEGVVKVLQILREEFDLAMALTGKSSVKDLHAGLIKKEIRYRGEVHCVHN